MRLDNERPSSNVEDRRSQGGMEGGFGCPRREGMRAPMGGGRGVSISTILLVVVAYFALKLIFGIDLLDLFTGTQPTNLPQ
jgi:predicted metalloprotease